MRADEIIIRVMGELDLEYGTEIDQNSVKNILEGVLYDYEIHKKSTALAPLNNMKDMILYYLTHCKISGFSDVTIEGYGRNLGVFAREIQKNVEDITTMDIRIHIANYSKTRVKNSTIATRTDILRGFFGWLCMEEYISKNPMARIKTIKAEDSLREPLTYEEMELLRGGCKTLRQKALLEFAYATCLRLSELEAVDIKDINWYEMKLRTIGKGNKERVVYFNARAKVYLQSYLASRTDNCSALFATLRKPITRMGKRSIQKEISKIQEQSKLDKNVYPHLLRHSGASHMLDKNIGIESISKILGHSDLSTTQIYAKVAQSNVEFEYQKAMNS